MRINANIKEINALTDFHARDSQEIFTYLNQSNNDNVTSPVGPEYLELSGNDIESVCKVVENWSKSKKSPIVSERDMVQYIGSKGKGFFDDDMRDLEAELNSKKMDFSLLGKKKVKVFSGDIVKKTINGEPQKINIKLQKKELPNDIVIDTSVNNNIINETEQVKEEEDQKMQEEVEETIVNDETGKKEEEVKVQKISSKEKKEIIERLKEKKLAKQKFLNDQNLQIENLFRQIEDLKSSLINMSQMQNKFIPVGLDDSNVEHWKSVVNNVNTVNVADPLTLIKDFSQNVINNSFGQFKFPWLEIFNIVFSLATKVKILEDLAVKFNDLQKVKREIEFTIAKRGEKGWSLNNSSIVKTKNLCIKNDSNTYIAPEIWNNMSIGEKILKSFKFSDFNQNPRNNVWKRMKKADKIKFLEKKREWRAKRIGDFERNDENVDTDLLNAMDRFIYYEWRDPRGYMIDILQENKDNYGDTETTKELLKQYVEYVNNCGLKGKIYNWYMYKGRRYLTKGYSSQQRCDRASELWKKRRQERSNTPAVEVPVFVNNNNNNSAVPKKNNNSKGNYNKNFLSRKRKADKNKKKPQQKENVQNNDNNINLQEDEVF